MFSVEARISSNGGTYSESRSVNLPVPLDVCPLSAGEGLQVRHDVARDFENNMFFVHSYSLADLQAGTALLGWSTSGEATKVSTIYYSDGLLVKRTWQCFI